MTTSGSVDFSLSRDQLIKAAYQQAKLLGEGDSPSTTQTTEANILLNMIVKLRQSDGMPLWALKNGFILPQTPTVGSANTTGISVGTTGGHVTNSYVTTTTSAASSSGGSTITLTSVSGVSNGYYIGVLLSSNFMFWTTVNGAPAGSVVTLASTLTGNVASGSRVYCYQTKVNRPLRIISAYHQYTSGGNRNPINVIEKDSYFRLGALTSTGTPNQLYYDPQLDLGVVYLFPLVTGGDSVVEFTYHRPFEDFDSSGDTADFPQEWYLPLMMELAFMLGAKGGLPIEERAQLSKEAEYYRQAALSIGYPEGSLYVEPDTSRG